MGLFSKIKKGFKKIFKGVKKIFKKVGKFVGKVLGSKWGKRLLMAAAIFTGGMALLSGFGAGAASTGGFVQKFLAGSEGFIKGLLNPVGTAKGAVAGFQGGGGLAGAAQGAATGSGALAAPTVTEGLTQSAGDLVTEGATEAATSTLEGGANALQPQATGIQTGMSSPVAGAPQMSPVPSGSELTAFGSPTAGAGAGGGGLLKGAADIAGKAGNAVFGKDSFLRSTGGGLIAANMISGLAQGKALEDQLKYGGYADRQWADPRQLEILNLAAQTRPRLPGGFLDRQRRYSEGIEASRFRAGGYQRGGAGGGDRGYATGTVGG